jgi:hypothetical protein
MTGILSPTNNFEFRLFCCLIIYIGFYLIFFWFMNVNILRSTARDPKFYEHGVRFQVKLKVNKGKCNLCMLLFFVNDRSIIFIDLTSIINLQQNATKDS